MCLFQRKILFACHVRTWKDAERSVRGRWRRIRRRPLDHSLNTIQPPHPACLPQQQLLRAVPRLPGLAVQLVASDCVCGLDASPPRQEELSSLICWTWLTLFSHLPSFFFLAVRVGLSVSLTSPPVSFPPHFLFFLILHISTCTLNSNTSTVWRNNLQLHHLLHLRSCVGTSYFDHS